MILPDGSEYPVFRPSRPNIIEQVRIVRKAVAYDAEVLVLECMALQPYLQRLCERKLICATHGVITNARADHLDIMGPTEQDVAWALASVIPKGNKFFTTERNHLEIFKRVAGQRAAEVISVDERRTNGVTETELDGFSYFEHAENVALALAVCEDLGVDRDVAVKGMWEGSPDPGVMREYQIEFFGRRIVFINGFAANDPESSERIWNMALEKHPEHQTRIALFNCRADRPERSLQLGQAYASWKPADRVVLIGSGTYIFARAATRAGINPSLLHFAEDRREDEIFETVVALAGTSALVMGFGNIGGQGLALVQYFSNRSVVREAI